MFMLIIGLAIVGFLTYIVLTEVPMPQVMKTIILLVVVVCVVCYLAQIFGFTDIPIPGRRR